MKMHETVITEAIKWGVPLRRDDKGYYHIVTPSTGKSQMASMATTAKSGLALIRKWRRTKKNPNFKSGRARSTTRAHRGVVAQDKKPKYVIGKAGKHRGVVKNPGRGRNLRKAVRLYTDFTGHDPKFIDEWTVVVPDTALQVGLITGILYKTRMDGKVQEFMHEFTGKSRPILAASADGTQLLVLGGDYKFTERGIVDGSYSIRR